MIITKKISLALSEDQFTNLLNYLGKKDTLEQSEMNSSSNLAGTCCLISSHNQLKWIVDIGVTDHMCNDINSTSHDQAWYG